VRASSAWALSTQLEVHDLGPALFDLAKEEPNSDVRRRVYEALVSQHEIPELLVDLVQQETDLATRIAGFNALAVAARRAAPSASLVSAFDNEIVPELTKLATSPNTLNLQMRAVFALRRADSPAARAALAAIAQSAAPQVATAARNGRPTLN
jgi:HEAT repeat protein